MEVLKSGELPWIVNNEFISDILKNKDVFVEIVGAVPTCNLSNMVFINYEQYEQFSPVFKYKFNKTNLCFEPIRCGAPQYYPNSDDGYKCLASTKICNLLLIFKDKCKSPKFELRDLETGKIHSSLPDDLYFNIVDQIKSKTNCKHISLRAMTTLAKESLLILAFQNKSKLFIVQIKYTHSLTFCFDSLQVLQYNLRSLYVSDICYDNIKNRLLILSKSSKGKGKIHSVDRSPTFKSFNFLIKPVVKFSSDLVPNTLTHLYSTIYLTVYSNNCKSKNMFYYEIIDLKN